jgi:hypothetical protein
MSGFYIVQRKGDSNMLASAKIESFADAMQQQVRLSAADSTSRFFICRKTKRFWGGRTSAVDEGETYTPVRFGR